MRFYSYGVFDAEIKDYGCDSLRHLQIEGLVPETLGFGARKSPLLALT